jgi:endoglucanase
LSSGAALMLVASSMPAAPVLAAVPVTGNGHTLPANTRFYVPPPPSGSVAQVLNLLKHRDAKDAYLVADMITTAQAVWLNGGTPAQVKKSVQKTVFDAALQKAVPVFVAYDIPGRDCAQYSKGGALTLADYEAWIDGVAAGIGKTNAVVIVEPDGLGNLPSNCGLDPSVYPFTDADRYTEINYAVDKLEAQPNTSVYLDATHNGWLNVGDAATRLFTAGVQRAQGFFLNVSNYQFSTNLVRYGTWVSQCLASGSFSGCPNQYWNGGPATSWSGTALSPYGQWSPTWSGLQADLPLTTAGIDGVYAGYPAGTAHFIIDTSRNGLGPWDYRSSYPSAGVAQDWCNPPGRGLGLQPTANTGVPLLDAYLWIKIPGASDGSCNRSVSGSTTDPEWGGIVDPAAGAWFPQMALQLVQNANPAIKVPWFIK